MWGGQLSGVNLGSGEIAIYYHSVFAVSRVDPSSMTLGHYGPTQGLCITAPHLTGCNAVESWPHLSLLAGRLGPVCHSGSTMDQALVTICFMKWHGHRDDASASVLCHLQQLGRLPTGS